jgi:hypothetical protein
MLKELGIKYGTDKVGHGYLPFYELHLMHLQDETKNVIEIGVHMAASLYMWRDFFKNGTIHGIDIVRNAKQYESDRIKIYIGDQANSSFLRDIGKFSQPLMLIVDDGGHMMKQQIVSFFELFPYLCSGGKYIIEDLHTSYHGEFKGDSAMTTMQYLKNMLDDLNYHGKHYGNRKSDDRDTYYEQSVASMCFCRSACIIEKK